MGRGGFTQDEIKVLRENPYVLNVNKKYISYSPKFKLLFMEEYLKGKRPTEIFREAGFDSKMLGSKRIERACARWKESYQSGTLGEFNAVLGSDDEKSSQLQEEAKQNRKDSTIDLCHQQELVIRKLRAENELLRQIRQRQEEIGRSLVPAEVCQIIERITQQDDYRRCTLHLCEVAGVSSSTFYKYRRAAHT